MKLSDYVDITRETPAHRALWQIPAPRALERGAMHTLPQESATEWLNARFGHMPNRYIFSAHICVCSAHIWNDQSKDYDNQLLTTDGEEFTGLYTPIVNKVSGLFPEYKSRPRSCVYDVTDEWERWELDWFVAKDATVYQPCVMIAFRDELLALQCKLALS
jgi:hypothetical protein